MYTYIQGQLNILIQIYLKHVNWEMENVTDEILQINYKLSGSKNGI